MMKSSLCFSLCLLLGLAAKPALTLSLVNNCSFSVHMPELRRYYSEIRLKAIREDTEIGVRILSITAMRDVQDDQTCCFLRLLLRFYVERVFRNFAGDQPQEQRSCSALANAFVAMKRNINKCHCLCNEETHKAIDSLETEFTKLSTDKAAKKAVAELDTLLDWLDEVDQASAPK
ncbi:interleukin 19 like isoform X2 [Hippocampus comes]|uniref:interleukin 19 like isoform X2 n=1 Tax=Hippocampus comes TaxID=109280 RepID=UPI00094EE36D|nr:PREDICTED: interleukin-20-like isoform X2 [Hippocampus comes]